MLCRGKRQIPTQRAATSICRLLHKSQQTSSETWLERRSCSTVGPRGDQFCVVHDVFYDLRHDLGSQSDWELGIR